MPTIHTVLLEAFAEWEIAFLLPTAREQFQLATRTYSPDGRPVSSIGGLHVQPDAALSEAELAPDDALVLCGSDVWQAGTPVMVRQAIEDAAAAGATLAAICAGTLALAEMGLLDERPHTSNSLAFLQAGAPRYQGARQYRSTPCVGDGDLITAAGTAPASFALAVLRQLLPSQAAALAVCQRAMAAEHAGLVFDWEEAVATVR